MTTSADGTHVYSGRIKALHNVGLPADRLLLTRLGGVAGVEPGATPPFKGASSLPENDSSTP
ncbi:hypothetical protein ACFHYQ_07285 [Sphaerimonospora cavernae]|uniref:Uncharacterized protein n=1 Tax=Sphaerimonospora cavernae TaxID=1740611 RepID=A0ABV6U0Z7_9ACTN